MSGRISYEFRQISRSKYLVKLPTKLKILKRSRQNSRKTFFVFSRENNPLSSKNVKFLYEIVKFLEKLADFGKKYETNFKQK